MGILRDVFRARGRSVVTIVGVAVGVFLVVLMGAMAENSNQQLESIDSYRGGTVTVAAQGASVNAFSLQTHSWIPRLLEADVLEQLREVPGVAEATPRVAMQLDVRAFWMGVPTTIVGGYSPARLTEQTELAEGRYADEGERGVVTLGADVAQQLDVGVGDMAELRGQPFEVVGVLGLSEVTALDQSAFVSLDDARSLFVDSFDSIYRDALGDHEVFTSIEVLAEEGVDPDRLADEIAASVDEVVAVGPEQLKTGSVGTAGTYNSLAVSMAVIALFAGGLSVVNTMVVSATERTREVGVKRALGATTSRIMRDVLAEAIVLGLLGGALGVLAGSLAVWVVDTALRASTGMGMFTLTPRLILVSLTFASVIGLIGGLYPARYAARLDPIDALGHV